MTGTPFDPVPDYLLGKILTGDPQDIANALVTVPLPSLKQLATEEVARLQHAYRPLTQNGKGANVIAAFAETIGVNPQVMPDYLVNHSIFRNHTYLSDPYIVRDLFDNDRSYGDGGGRLINYTGPAKNTLFQPVTTWAKAGDGVFRFAIMYRYLQDQKGTYSKKDAQVRTPVVMIDGHKMDQILQHDGPNSTILRQMKDLADIVCHDYIHTAFLYYVTDNAPDGVKEWDDQLRWGKQIWRESFGFNYNYEVLATIGHRKIIEHVYEKHPEIKEALVARVSDFSESVQALCDAMRSGGEHEEATKMERYLITNYMRFAFHVLKPDEPALAWVKEAYPYIEKDLNLHNGKGLVAILRAHDGVPSKDSGERDVPFSEWLNHYVVAHIPIMAARPHYRTRMEARLESNGQNGGMKA